MKKLRIFVSSVQKELEVERVAVAGWVSADPQLSEFCEVVLFEKEPLSGNLNHLRLMDQRGSGIGRMRTAMLNHGLSTPEYALIEGYFRVNWKTS